LPPSSLKTQNAGRTSGPARDHGTWIEVNIDDRDDGAMTELVPAALGDKDGGAAAFARAFPCGRRQL
jgi:hypothetical protein